MVPAGPVEAVCPDRPGMPEGGGKGGGGMAVVTAGRGRIARLLQLILALGAGRWPNARELAAACEVSRRTIYRDLDVLELAGVPVRYRADRQGYELPPGFGFSPPALEESEAAALLLLADQGGDGLGLATTARSAARKVYMTLPAEARERLRGLLGAAGPGASGPPPPPPPAPGRQAVYDAILQSLGRGLQVRAWYLGSDQVTADATKLSPYRLVCVPMAWKLVGRSSFHRGVRTFSVARILRAELTDDPYAIPPRLATAHDCESSGTAIPGSRLRGREVLLRLTRQVAPEFLESPARSLLEVHKFDDGGVVARIGAATFDEALAWVLPLADQVEVLAPPELRARLAELAGRVSRLHARPGPAGLPAPDLRSPVPLLATERTPPGAGRAPGDWRIRPPSE